VKSRLFNLLAVASFLVCVVTMILWVRGWMVAWDGIGIGYQYERGTTIDVNSFDRYRVLRAGDDGHTIIGTYFATESGSYWDTSPFPEL
jgi:hypothetical protein